MNLVSKLRKEFNTGNHHLNNDSVFFYTEPVIDPEDSIVVYFETFKKWVELSSKYNSFHLTKYFKEWILWKFTEEMKPIIQVIFKYDDEKVYRKLII